MVSFLHLTNFSQLTFEECHNKLYWFFGIPRNSILIQEIDFLFWHTDKVWGSHLENCPPAIVTLPGVIIARYEAILGKWEHKNFCNHLSNSNTNLQ